MSEYAFYGIAFLFFCWAVFEVITVPSVYKEDISFARHLRFSFVRKLLSKSIIIGFVIICIVIIRDYTSVSPYITLSFFLLAGAMLFCTLSLCLTCLFGKEKFLGVTIADIKNKSKNGKPNQIPHKNNIEPLILPLVDVIEWLGGTTIASCQGHWVYGRNFFEPYVYFSGSTELAKLLDKGTRCAVGSLLYGEWFVTASFRSEPTGQRELVYTLKKHLPLYELQKDSNFFLRSELWKKIRKAQVDDIEMLCKFLKDNGEWKKYEKGQKQDPEQESRPEPHVQEQEPAQDYFAKYQQEPAQESRPEPQVQAQESERDPFAKYQQEPQVQAQESERDPFAKYRQEPEQEQQRKRERDYEIER